MPDKRYCFDHFRPESTLVDVLLAHTEKRSEHDLRTVLSHELLMTHNDPARHWVGDHGEKPCIFGNPQWVPGAFEKHRSANGAYLDCHAWQFTPDSFADIAEWLSTNANVDLAPQAIYPTPFNSNEFCAVLTKPA